MKHLLASFLVASLSASISAAPLAVAPNGDGMEVEEFREKLEIENVDNTADTSKPISTATQTALDLKVALSGNQTLSGVKTMGSGSTFAWSSGATFHSTSGAIVTIDNPSTWRNALAVPALAGSNTLTGQLELTGQAATNSTSAITRALGDARYGGELLMLYVNADVSAPSTTNVNYGTTLAVPAGTYEFDFNAVGRTVSSTGGIQIGVVPSNLSADFTTATILSSTSTGDGATATPSLASRSGANLFQYSAFSLVDGSASLKSCQANSRGTVTFSVSQTLTFRVRQRTTTDGSNPALLKQGSFIWLKKVP